MTDTERSVVQKILCGDTQAFKAIVADYQRLVYHVIFRLVENAADREDLCQDIFVKVYENLPGFHFDSKLSTWIARIAYNCALNYRKKKKMPLYEDRCLDGESAENIVCHQRTPDEFTESNDLALHLHLAIRTLPPNFAEIISLYHLEEMSYEEIGDIMQLPSGTVKSYLYRARKLLKDRLMATCQREAL